MNFCPKGLVKVSAASSAEGITASISSRASGPGDNLCLRINRLLQDIFARVAFVFKNTSEFTQCIHLYLAYPLAGHP